MSDPSPRLYEGLFLVDQRSGVDHEEALEHLRQILERAEAEIEVLSRWEERRLAYAIKGQRRGLYLIAYFRARGAQVPNIERDVNLSEVLLRGMVIRADHLGEEELEDARQGKFVMGGLPEPAEEEAKEVASEAPEAKAPSPGGEEASSPATA